MDFKLEIVSSSESVRKDVEQIVEMWRDCFYEDSKYYPSIDNLTDYFIERGLNFLVLKNNVGEIFASVEYFHDEIEDCFYISNLCTKERRKGYGSRLLDFLKDLERPIKLECWIWKGVEDDTQEFYIKNGFEEVGRHSMVDDEMVEEVIEFLWRNK